MEKIFSFLAVFAVILNFLVPVTHSLIATAEAGELVEICTKNGIELVSLSSSQGDDAEQREMDGECPACPDCPLCQSGAAKNLLKADDGFSVNQRTSAVLHGFTSGTYNVAEDPLWVRPALRAPPKV